MKEFHQMREEFHPHETYVARFHSHKIYALRLALEVMMRHLSQKNGGNFVEMALTKKWSHRVKE